MAFWVFNAQKTQLNNTLEIHIYIFHNLHRKYIEYLVDNYSDWFKFQPIKIGLRNQNFENLKKFEFLSNFDVLYTL